MRSLSSWGTSSCLQFMQPLAPGHLPAESTHSVHGVMGLGACWGRDELWTGATASQGPFSSPQSRAARERRTYGAETGAKAQLRAKGVRAQQGRKEPRGAAASAGGGLRQAGLPCWEGGATGRGLSCSLNCLPGRPPGWASVACPGRAHPWRCGPGGRQAWLVLLALPRCRGARRATGPLQTGAGPGRCFPRPRALSLSEFPPPGDPLARVPALPTGDHPPELWRRGCHSNLVRQSIRDSQSYKTALYSAFSSREIVGPSLPAPSRGQVGRALPGRATPEAGLECSRKPDTQTALPPLPTPTVDGPHDSEIVL